MGQEGGKRREGAEWRIGMRRGKDWRTGDRIGALASGLVRGRRRESYGAWAGAGVVHGERKEAEAACGMWAGEERRAQEGKERHAGAAGEGRHIGGVRRRREIWGRSTGSFFDEEELGADSCASSYDYDSALGRVTKLVTNNI
ncbi:hypothetical protein E2562_028399 [Oryza meyeriana var. granulata]|uniref:Uncharacterized protein n=1 Tax=Oryza meyeriana var. granulata TaxID=110450 RepID=A0A6G1E1Y3_9ORYZ|nr:hypothetical protein E2562_028399 [Oryza meyeriana var. granulata]